MRDAENVGGVTAAEPHPCETPNRFGSLSLGVNPCLFCGVSHLRNVARYHRHVGRQFRRDDKRIGLRVEPGAECFPDATFGLADAAAESLTALDVLDVDEPDVFSD